LKGITRFRETYGKKTSHKGREGRFVGRGPGTGKQQGVRKKKDRAEEKGRRKKNFTRQKRYQKNCMEGKRRKTGQDAQKEKGRKKNSPIEQLSGKSLSPRGRRSANLREGSAGTQELKRNSPSRVPQKGKTHQWFKQRLRKNKKNKKPPSRPNYPFSEELRGEKKKGGLAKKRREKKGTWGEADTTGGKRPRKSRGGRGKGNKEEEKGKTLTYDRRE